MNAEAPESATLEKVEVFCDGSCLGNPGPGGWAALLVTHAGPKKMEKLVAGGQPATTNNQMELRAAIEGLRILKRKCRVHLYTDSNYVVKGMSEWRHGWVKRGWVTSAKKAVENRALWEELIEQAAHHVVTWHWVKGHAGHAENERVDEAARNEATRVARGG